MVHGDMWTHNILWNKTADGKLSNSLRSIIDWQLVHQGCCKLCVETVECVAAGGSHEDLCHLLMVCVDGDIRRKHDEQILRVYFDKLSSHIATSGKEMQFDFDHVINKRVRCNCMDFSCLIVIAELFRPISFICYFWLPCTAMATTL